MLASLDNALVEVYALINGKGIDGFHQVESALNKLGVDRETTPKRGRWTPPGRFLTSRSLGTIVERRPRIDDRASVRTSRAVYKQ